MYRFRLGSTQRKTPPLKDLHGAHLLGGDGVAVRGDLRLKGGEIQCDVRIHEPTGLSLVWPVADFGAVQLETTRLPNREQPYDLPLELVRHRLMRINMKREEWGLFDYPGMEDLATRIEEARALFVKALQHSDTPERAMTFAEKALLAALAASEDISGFHAGVFINRRRQMGGFAKPFLGVGLPARMPDEQLLNAIRPTFDFVRLPMVWREIQPKEQGISFDYTDAWVSAASEAGIGLVGGPLLNFGVRFVPDWMYIWENDFETIIDYAREQVRRTVQRYASRIDRWIVASGLHADNALAFSFEQIMELTRMAATTARSLAPKSQILLELTQPWGEYYARNQQTVPPWLYADMAVQGGVPFDAFGVQFLFGIDSDGFHLRDMLQISALIDRLANFGKALHVTAIAVPSTKQSIAGGKWREEWSAKSQAAWLDAFMQVALSKPYVESVALHTLCDGPDCVIPESGVLKRDGDAKPALEMLRRLRTRLRTPGE